MHADMALYFISASNCIIPAELSTPWRHFSGTTSKTVHRVQNTPARECQDVMLDLKKLPVLQKPILEQRLERSMPYDLSPSVSGNGSGVSGRRLERRARTVMFRA